MYLWQVYFVNIKGREFLAGVEVIAGSDQDASLLATKIFEEGIDKTSRDIFWNDVKTGVVKVYPKMILEIDSWREKG